MFVKLTKTTPKTLNGAYLEGQKYEWESIQRKEKDEFEA